MAEQDSLWIIVDSSHFGGIESHIFQLSTGLHRRKAPVRVIFLNDYSDLCGPHPLLTKLHDYGIPTAKLNGRFTTLIRLIRRYRPSLCHAHGYKAGIYTRFAGLVTNTPCITTYHAGEHCRGKLGLYDLLDRSTALFNSSSTAVSDLIAKRVYAPCQQMNNFIETNGLLQSKGEATGFVGRLSEEKDPEAFMKLAHTFQNSNFIIFGDGPLRAKLTKLAQNNCHIRGHVEMNNHWGELKCLVICSKFEGLPLCLLEAMARGIVVIAYDLGQISHVIEHKKNGYLVPKGDFQSLKKHLRIALSLNSESFEALSKKARNTIFRYYSTSAVLPKYISLYQKHSNITPLTEIIVSRDRKIKSIQIEKPLTVLFVHYGENWIRGSEICLINLVTNIRKLGVKPLVWCNSEVLYEELKRRGINAIKQHFTILFGWEKPRFDALNFAKLIQSANQLIEQHRVDVIHTNGGAPNQWMLISARKTSTPIITQLHAPYLLRDRISLSLRDPDIVVGVSKAVIEPFIKDRRASPLINTENNFNPDHDSAKHSKYTVIYNGIDLSKYQQHSSSTTKNFDLRKRLNISENAYVIISVGSLIHRKGFDLLIEAISNLRKNTIEAELVIIGDGCDRSALHALSEKLGTSHCVHFLGERNDVSTLLQSNVDVYASGARDEAFGLVLAEAGAAGLASVAPRVGGIPEVVEHQKSGILVEPNSSYEIALALYMLHKFSTKRKSMGQHARSLVFNKFSLDENTHKFKRLYMTLERSNVQQSWSTRVQAYLSPFISLIKLSLKSKC